MATITVTINTAQNNRLKAAVGRKRGLQNPGPPATPRDATNAEVKEQVRQFLVEVVRGQEVSKACTDAENSVQDITPT